MSKTENNDFVTKFIIVLQLCYLVFGLNDTEKSYSTSIRGMVKLLDMEKQLIDNVENYTIELQIKVDAFRNLVNELKEENLKSINKREEYLFNPLNGFSLIRRLYNDWPKFEQFMLNPVGQEYLSVLHKYRLEMPTATDLREASAAIHRLHAVYDLQVNDLVRGMINGKQYDVKLKSIDAYFIACYLFTKKLFYPAELWLNHSVNSFKEEKDFYQFINFGKQKPLELYAEALVMQNRPEEALRFIMQASDLKPFDSHLMKRKQDIQLMAGNTENGPPLQISASNVSNYQLGCRGHFLEHPTKMVCLYNTNTTPFLRLAPVKMEILSFQPYIVVFHDVLADQEIERLKHLAWPNLVRAEVVEGDSWKSIEVDEDRTSQYSYFEDDADEVIERINKRTADITGLDVADMEYLQVGNYILGGHYGEHYDFFNVSHDIEPVTKGGDRFCTVLFYLSDVEQGGATVFPEIKVSTFPRKGSALVWYNLNNRLEGDDQTRHAACPVIVGSKWVATKWIRANGQMFKKPCYN